MNENAGVFYVVVEGKLVMETCIEIDTYHKFPCGAKEWELKKKTRKIIYKLREITAGDYFGHEEMILNVNRRIQVRALSNATLMYTNRSQFEKCAPKLQLEILKQQMENVLHLDIT
jgi:CRP-like cAMP-binding protein